MTSGAQMALVALLTASALLGGCAQFQNPAVAESGPAFDTALAGHWVLNSKEGEIHVEIRSRGAGGVVIARELAKTGESKVEEAQLLTARLGQINLMSLRSESENDAHWSIFRYDFDRGRLVVTQGSDEYWKKAVEDGRLEGRVEKGRLSTTITVTASEAQLRSVILDYGSVIFVPDPTPEFVFERAR